MKQMTEFGGFLFRIEKTGERNTVFGDLQQFHTQKCQYTTQNNGESLEKQGIEENQPILGKNQLNFGKNPPNTHLFPH